MAAGGFIVADLEQNEISSSEDAIRGEIRRRVKALAFDAEKRHLVGADLGAGAIQALSSGPVDELVSTTSSSVASDTLDVIVEVRKAGIAFVALDWKRDDPPPWKDELEASMCDGGIMISGKVRRVRRRRAAKRERVEDQERRVEAKKRAAERSEAKRPAWRPDKMLPLFPSRKSCLDQNVMMADLNSELMELIEGVYLPSVFPPSCRDEVIGALRQVRTDHPKSLRVKELIETVESFKLISKQISHIHARDGEASVQSVYDLACGHGLLGVLLAYRFSNLQVICVDLERRNCFDHYVEAFRKHGEPDTDRGETVALSNLDFAEGDILSVADRIDSTSFLTIIHGCNEASKVVLDLAREKEAPYAVLPCCIRDGLYPMRSVTRIDDATRYSIMVGMLAGIYGAHWVASIDRFITNRNLVLFGGYEPIS